MIEFKSVSKVYLGGKVAVHNVNLKIEEGQFIVFIGTSGSGKTTCMRMINKMIEPSSGNILIDGKDIKNMNDVALRRSIGYVIQQIGLMPHMNIFENIVMVPRLLKMPENKLREIAENLIKKVDLPVEYLDRYPKELSGGQQQRIGVIRALSANQNIILMDEPFGALDPITRENLQTLVKNLQVELGKTFIFVTHDIDEALLLADKIAIMDNGQVIQYDTPQNILKSPANDFVKNLLGEKRLDHAKFDYLPVEEVMIRNPKSINYKKTTHEAMEIMHNSRVDSLFLVDDENVLIGMADVFDIRSSNRESSKIEDYKLPVNAINRKTPLRDAIFYINKLGYRNLPIVDEEMHLIGLVTRASVMDIIYKGFLGDYTPEKNDNDIIVTSDMKEV
ncbi:choline ABC transporter, ATP-binding protein OpuBA [Peptoanaerobacter stomatis]|uniref:Quaternary amine transport ATP-binding protein n=1 Tax=Peptoanaerobacter stomatis TaxID=796937 RepID=J6H2A4_9FIRM|nr:ABC transporter ATP-binding protein [Peptoanaerobacter stomatis]EJU19530.1 choline ABC transporter, ATP-binding protein OpuBA [Peptoanaerobacter stomatis]NWO25327.1 ABC transporter ATP-binding protein [Peptostreptococcaceae bacterium oral taxon 081]